MPTYECSRQVECLLTVEATDKEDLKRKLAMPADDLVEQADAVAFGSVWIVIENGKSGVMEITDEAIEKRLNDDPEPWVE